MELRSLYGHLQARIPLANLYASQIYEVVLFAEKDAAVIDTIAAAQQEELEKEIEGLKANAEQCAAEVEKLVGEVPF